MARRVFSAEKIINLLSEAKVLLGQGQTLDGVCRKLSISRQTYYRWRKSYGGIRAEQEKRLKKLERQNGRLKRLVRDLSLDNAILKAALLGN
jgi:transposase-like protein